TMILPSTGCWTRRSTFTTTVLSILLLTTRPIRVRWRLAGAVVWVSLILLSCLLSHDGTDARDVTAHFAKLAGVGKLLSGTLHTQVELCLQQAFELFGELAGVFGTEFARFHDVSLNARLARHEGRAQRQLGGGEAESFASHFLAHAFHFVDHLAGLDFGDPELRTPLPVTHTDFRRLLGNGLVREYTDPATAAALDVAVDGTTGCLDLTGSQTTTVNGLEAEFTERDLRATSCQASVAALVLFAILSA